MLTHRIKLLVVVLLLLFSSACKSPETLAEADKRQVFESCYEKNDDGGRVFMNLKIDETNVAGSLVYALKEKDRNSGTFSGVIKGDMIYVQYRFRSEGVDSVRDIIFSKKAKSISEKAIELADGKNTKYVSTGIELEKTECVKDEKGCFTQLGFRWSEAEHKCLMQ